MSDAQDSKVVLQGVADDIAQINKEISNARTLLSAVKDAGEDTTQLETDIRTLEIRRDKWVRMLKARNIDIPK